MPRRKRHPKMPHWLWVIHPKMLTWKDKHFLSYLWWTGDHGAHSWNYRLAKMFHCSSRTIRRRLQKFKKLHLIHIGHAQDRGRTIWANPYYSHEVWLSKATKAQRHQGGTKLATINNAQQENSYKERYSPAGTQKGAASKAVGSKETAGRRALSGASTSSVAAGAGGSREGEKIPRFQADDDPIRLGKVLDEYEEMMLQSAADRARRKRERGE